MELRPSGGGRRSYVRQTWRVGRAARLERMLGTAPDQAVRAAPLKKSARLSILGIVDRRDLEGRAARWADGSRAPVNVPVLFATKEPLDDHHNYCL